MSAYYVKRIYYGPVAQWIEQLPSKQLVVGSIPARATIFFAFELFRLHPGKKQILTLTNKFVRQDFFFLQ